MPGRVSHDHGGEGSAERAQTSVATVRAGSARHQLWRIIAWKGSSMYIGGGVLLLILIIILLIILF